MKKPLSCEDIRALSVDLMMNEVSQQERDAVGDHITSCKSCQQELSAMEHLWSQLYEAPEQPTENLRNNFYSMLSGEIEKQHAAKRGADWTKIFRRLWPQSPQWAMAYTFALLLSGFGVGQFGDSSVFSPRLAAVELDQIRGEVSSLKNLIALNLLGQDSAQARLQGVSYAQQTSHQDRRLLLSLMEVAAQDKTRNVRLAALDALYKYQHEPELTVWVEEQLPRETSLLVQLKLAEMLLESAGSQRGERLSYLLAEDTLFDELKSYLREQEIKSAGDSSNAL